MHLVLEPNSLPNTIQIMQRHNILQLQQQRSVTLTRRRRGAWHVQAKMPGITLAATAARDGPSLLTLPVVGLGQVLHPTNTGTLQVFEDHMLPLFKDLLANGKSAEERRFVHIVSGRAVPQALLEEIDDKFQGLPRIGCAAEVTKVLHSDEAGVTLEYVGHRRIQLIQMQQREPYKVGLVEWVDDESLAQNDDLADRLERDLYQALCEVHHLTQVVATSTENPLTFTDAVWQYAPPEGPQGPLAAPGEPLEKLLRSAGLPAAQQVAVWRASGGPSGGPAGAQGPPGAPAKGPRMPPEPAGSNADIYKVMQDGLGKQRRQELFSFAAAGLLEPAPAIRSALLITRDTAARLQFVSEVVKPYIQQLRAQAAIQEAAKLV